MWWRVPKGGKTWDEAKGAKNRDRFRRLVKAGKVHGVLAFAGDEPVGWCAFGPRDDFPRIQSVKALRGHAEEGTWAVVCFYIPSRWRGRGVASALLAAATKQALALGARKVEGYPVVPREEGKEIPAAFAWTGVPALFERAGYAERERPSTTRPIFVKESGDLAV